MAPSLDVEVNNGASTSSTAEQTANKVDKKKNLPWIEKYRPQKFDEIMGKIFEMNFDQYQVLIKLFIR